MLSGGRQAVEAVLTPSSGVGRRRQSGVGGSHVLSPRVHGVGCNQGFRGPRGRGLSSGDLAGNFARGVAEDALRSPRDHLQDTPMPTGLPAGGGLGLHLACSKGKALGPGGVGNRMGYEMAGGPTRETRKSDRKQRKRQGQVRHKRWLKRRKRPEMGQGAPTKGRSVKEERRGAREGMRPWGIEETGGRPLGEELTSGVVTPGRYLCRKSYLGLPAIEEAGGRPPGGEVTSGVITLGRHNETREKSLGKDMAGEPGRTDGGYGEGMEVALCRKSYLGLPGAAGTECFGHGCAEQSMHEAAPKWASTNSFSTRGAAAASSGFADGMALAITAEAFESAHRKKDADQCVTGKS